MSTVSVAAAAALRGDRLVAVIIALAGVALARTVFVDRENKKLGRRQSMRETLPLTLTAMLIAGVIVFDQDLGYSKAAFTGLGVGWAAITALDAIGRRIVDPSGDDAAKDEQPRHKPVRRNKLKEPILTPDEAIDDHLARLDRVARYEDAGSKPGP